MAIPDYQTLMLPLMKILADGHDHLIRDLYQLLANQFHLTHEERQTKLPSGHQSVIDNRIGWARTHLKAAGLVDIPIRGTVRITSSGRELLATNPSAITIKTLKEYPAYKEFWSKPKDKDETETALTPMDGEPGKTPLELLNASFETLQDATKADLLARLKSSLPSFFEKAVLKLLTAMGYGGVDGQVEVTGKPGDGGIDGKIWEDKLGLDVICVQAKRYESNSVGRPAVQSFVGSMDMNQSKKGVILTTSEFTKEAREFINKIVGKKVVLIDGKMLTDLMVVHNVGVTTSNSYEVKEVSNDFFEDDG